MENSVQSWHRHTSPNHLIRPHQHIRRDRHGKIVTAPGAVSSDVLAKHIVKARHLVYTLTVNLAPVLLWMIVIFILSTDSFSSAATTPLVAPFLFLHLFPGLSAIHVVETIELLIRKLAHGSEYFILAILLMRAVNARSAGIVTKRHMIWSLTVAVIYALSDEWHQSFVPSRSASVSDVIIDAIGASCGILSSYLRSWRTNMTSPP